MLAPRNNPREDGLEEEEENRVTNLVSSEEEESSDGESEYYYFQIIILNKVTSKFISVRRRSRITFHCLRKAICHQLMNPFGSYGFTLKFGDDRMVELGEEKELMVMDENFDLTSAGDGSIDKPFRLFIQSRI